ncbi:hypothetical protein [Vibrio parahaemolyticus]|uniref:hypothetical protein n=1 Tax=Vibrio parahaemolyticus TaxID=670 RepID=UPI001B84549B|nr:hypothetical protein [Vibrio parahaemolyticus]MDF5073874.1 hypothetical protein [Vibrio parahaemolyticus]MDF5410556.1 hypothetical protein [Vibrio parahaemolyticus]MDF5421021.1 hypothetical protein [Vibrio parahaemolyticus]HBC3859688.1 hypothetical protein [Vibrio parahaemolyticus]
MLSFEERLALLEKELAETSPETVLAELQSYEAKGPLAYDFLEEIVEYQMVCTPKRIPLVTQTIKVTAKNDENYYRNDAYTESLGFAA